MKTVVIVFLKKQIYLFYKYSYMQHYLIKLNFLQCLDIIRYSLGYNCNENFIP